MGRMLCYTLWSKSSPQNLKEKEYAFKVTQILKDLNCHEPRIDCQKPDLVMDTLGTSHSSILHILTKELAMRKVSAR